MIQSKKSDILLRIEVSDSLFKIPNSTAVFTLAHLKPQDMSLKSFP